MFKDTYRDVVKAIKKAKTIYIATHKNPDGDAVGSSIGLMLGLRKLGKKVKVILPSYSDTFSVLEETKNTYSKIEEDEVDLLIFTDLNALDRASIRKEDVKKAKYTAVVDHHKQNGEPFADYIIVEDFAPAACEVVYKLLKRLKVKIDKDIATYLYAGIMTDTGSFKYSSTSPITHIIAADLIEKGVDFATLGRELLDKMKEEKLNLLSLYISKLEKLDNKRIIYGLVEYDEIEKLGLNDEDSEGMTNYGQSIDGCEVSIYVRGKSDGTYKVSMRSNGKVDIATIAQKYLGGGHTRAAGFTVETKERLEEIKEELVETIKEQLA